MLLPLQDMPEYRLCESSVRAPEPAGHANILQDGLRAALILIKRRRWQRHSSRSREWNRQPDLASTLRGWWLEAVSAGRGGGARAAVLRCQVQSPDLGARLTLD